MFVNIGELSAPPISAARRPVPRPPFGDGSCGPEGPTLGPCHRPSLKPLASKSSPRHCLVATSGSTQITHYRCVSSILPVSTEITALQAAVGNITEPRAGNSILHIRIFVTLLYHNILNDSYQVYMRPLDGINLKFLFISERKKKSFLI
jgi:hypothetical protein